MFKTFLRKAHNCYSIKYSALSVQSNVKPFAMSKSRYFMEFNILKNNPKGFGKFFPKSNNGKNGGDPKSTGTSSGRARSSKQTNNDSKSNGGGNHGNNDDMPEIPPSLVSALTIAAGLTVLYYLSVDSRNGR
jgi:hypothetical protein